MRFKSIKDWFSLKKKTVNEIQAETKHLSERGWKTPEG